jgi:hypothetical protein
MRNFRQDKKTGRVG